MRSPWVHGDLVIRSEALGLQPPDVHERTGASGVWLEVPVFVVEDSPELVGWVRDYGAGLVDRLGSQGPWWDRSWSRWTPPDEWG